MKYIEKKRMQTGSYSKTKPTIELLKETNNLSIYQLGIESILNQTKKILIAKRPNHLYGKLQLTDDRKGNMKASTTRNRLNRLDEGFVNKSRKLLNMLPPEILAEEDFQRIKKMSRQWIKSNIKAKPY